MSYNPETDERDADLNGMGVALPNAEEDEDHAHGSNETHDETEETMLNPGMMPPHLISELRKGRTSRQTSELIQQIERAVINGEPISSINAMPPIQEALLSQIDQAYNGTESGPGLRGELMARNQREAQQDVKGGLVVLGSLLGWNKQQIQDNPQAVLDEAEKSMGVVEKWIKGPFAALVKTVQSWAGGTQAEVESAGAALARSGTKFRGPADMETVSTVGHGVQVSGPGRRAETGIS